MLKTLIATGLITANIMGAVNSTSNSIYYTQNNWITTVNDQYDFIKEQLNETQSFNNDVMSYETRVLNRYDHDRMSDTQIVMGYTFTRVKAKKDIDRYSNVLNSENPQTQLITSCSYAWTRSDYTDNVSLSMSHDMDTIFQMTSIDWELVNDVTTFIQDYGTNTMDVSTTDENHPTQIIELYSQVGFQYLNIEEGTEIITIKRIYINKNTSNPPEINFEWQDDWDYLSRTPGSVTVAYDWTYTVPEGYEVIDIPGLLFNILGMPFAFMSYAFNLTIFPNTPYAINLSHVFLALIVSGIIIFIIKKVYK